MNINKVDHSNMGAFVKFCQRVREVVGDSYLEDHELEAFLPTEENPSYLLYDGENLLGAASLMVEQDNRTARFRILHSTIPSKEAYQSLFEAILEDIEDIDIDTLTSIFPLALKQAMVILLDLSFEVERYIFVLERLLIDCPESDFPDGYTIRPMIENKEEAYFCDVRNAAFADLKGSNPITVSKAITMQQSTDYLIGGTLLLFDGDSPVGTVRVGKEPDGSEEIASVLSLSVLPSYKGLGLGRNLLRAALQHARSFGLPKVYLCVNADNEHASSLYIQEGFEKTDSFVSLIYNTK